MQGICSFAIAEHTLRWAQRFFRAGKKVHAISIVRYRKNPTRLSVQLVSALYGHAADMLEWRGEFRRA